VEPAAAGQPLSTSWPKLKDKIARGAKIPRESRRLGSRRFATEDFK
jgi:hypothetical protein